MAEIARKLASAASAHPAARLLRDAGPTVSMREGATVVGVSKDTFYRMHADGALAELGIRVLKLGQCLRVSTADLRRAVGLDDGGGTAA